MVQVDSNTPLNIRIKFKKVGSLQYISHLDLVRTMSKIIVRSKLPLWYTEGFNPKPKMVFAAPLSIGTESLTEFCDIRLNERVSEEFVKEAINNNTTKELEVIEAYYPETKLTDMKWLSYDILIKTDSADAELAAKCVKTLMSDKVLVEKTNKNKETVTVNIREQIKSIEGSFDGENILLRCVLSAESSSFLNPEYLIKVLKREHGILSCGDLLREYYSINRIIAYKADMTEFK